MTGIDVLPVDNAVNAVVPTARAKISLRIHPAQDPSEAQAALVRHLESMRPFGIPLEVEAAEIGQGLLRDHVGPGVRRRTRRAREPPGAASPSASRPAARSRSSAPSARRFPTPRSCCFGTTDGFANIHAPNERVLLDEFEKAVLAEAEFFGRFADRRVAGRRRDS